MTQRLPRQPGTRKKVETYLSKEEQVKLASSAAGGDNRAWGTLYESFHKALQGFIAGKVGNMEDAEDLCQETFITAQKNLSAGKYDPKYSFYSFLRNIAIFAIKKHWEKIGRRESGGRISERGEREKNVTENIADTRHNQEYAVDRLEMLRLVILCCAKPHQIIAHQFVNLLQWKPQEIASELSELNLGQLSKMFFNSYLETFNGLIDRKTLYRYTYDQFIKFKKLTVETYTEAEYAKKLKGFQRTRVADLVFKLFYSKKREASLHDWCHKVKERVRKALEEGILCREGQ